MSSTRCFGRRDILALMAAGAILAPASRVGATVPTEERVAFDVLREGRSIGHHLITFRPDGGDLYVDIEIALQVDFAFLTLFRYEHRNREHWRDGRLISLVSQTDDNGTPYRVRATAADDGLRIEGNEGSYTAPADLMPTSYWNPRTVEQSRLLDSQRGRLLSVEVQAKGNDQVILPRQAVEARQYRMAGDLNLDIWYGAQGELLKLAFEAKGSRIEYAPVETGRPSAI